MSRMDENGNGGDFFPKILVLKIGNYSNWKELKFWLDFKGYTRCSTVSAEGEYAEVGSSILIWQRGDTSPLILDRFGEILERAQVEGKWLSKGSLMILPFCMNQPSAALNHSEVTTRTMASNQKVRRGILSTVISTLFSAFRIRKHDAVKAAAKPDRPTESHRVGQATQSFAKSPRNDEPHLVPAEMSWDGLYFPRFWTKRSAKSKGLKVPIEAWGWGETPEAADAVATYRLAIAKSKADIQKTDWNQYGYGLGGMPLREQLIDMISKDQNGLITAALTRNRYGALILSTSHMMMIDIDFPNNLSPNGREEFILSARAKLASEEDRSFLLFETAGGLRAICTNKPYKADAPETSALMVRVGADPLYIRLCKEQKCFRSRITPKPWRIIPPMKVPEGDLSDAWIASYEKYSAPYQVCRSLGWIGPQDVLPIFYDALAIHNQAVKKGNDSLA